MSNEKLMTYALDQTSKLLVHISKVKNGLECDCICPSCGGMLIAKKGNFREYHFSHYNCSECSGGAETALHLAAKKIVLEAKELTLPNLTLGNGLFVRLKQDFDHRLDEISLYNLYNDLDSRIISRVKKIPIDSVESEKPLYLDESTHIIPDLIITSHNRKLIVEIAVTHKVDFRKKEKLEKANISALEIVLSSNDYTVTPEELKHRILDSYSNKMWLFNAKAHEVFKYYYSNSTEINYRFKRGDPYSKNRCKRTGQINKSCADCFSNLMFDGEVEWCCYPLKIEI